MNPITLDALQLVHDHEAVMTLLAQGTLTSEQRESLESLDELLSDLRGRVLQGMPLEYLAVNLEAARTFDRERMLEKDLS